MLRVLGRSRRPLARFASQQWQHRDACPPFPAHHVADSCHELSLVGRSLEGSRGFASFSTSRGLSPRASSNRVDIASKRTSVLAEEIERMKKLYEKHNKTPPKPFKLKDEPGRMAVLLQRRKGPEDVVAKCELLFHPKQSSEDLTPEELNGEEEEQKLIANVTMTITKGGPQALEISVECYRNGYAINHIKYREDKDVKFEDDDEYFPEFWRVSPKIREEFHKFLEARGLNEEFANWVHDKLDDKAFQERLRLLEKVNAFIEAKD